MGSDCPRRCRTAAAHSILLLSRDVWVALLIDYFNADVMLYGHSRWLGNRPCCVLLVLSCNEGGKAVPALSNEMCIGAVLRSLWALLVGIRPSHVALVG